MNKLISFHLSKLLKEKGFDYHELYHDFSDEYDYLVEGEYHRRHNSDFSEEKFPDDKWLAVPYISQVVIWLYEKHKIWIVVDNLIDNKFYFSTRNIETTDYESRTGCSEDGYDTWVSAYESAIEYTLNNKL